jgi:serine/threonine-protein phosphatase 2B catalytic subunit
MTLEELCRHISGGGAVGVPCLQSLLLRARQRGGEKCPRNVEDLRGEEVIVFGPIRGHGADLARVLQDKVLGRAQPPAVVFLGNMIDGGCQSMETIALVLAAVIDFGDRVVALRGAHEFLFPISAECIGRLAGRLEAEIRTLCGSCVLSSSDLCKDVGEWFSSLPLAVIINDLFFAVSSGIAPEALGSLDEMNAAKADDLIDMLINDPMDEDDEDTVSSRVAFASNLERQVGHVFTFNATCNFLTKHGYRCIIRGNPFTTQRTSVGSNSCGRPWHYQYSPNDCGFRLYRKCPTTGLPGVISLFSAPGFCCANTNLGAVARLTRTAIALEQFGTNPNRPLQLPGATQNAFHWSMAFVCAGLTSAVSHMLFGEVGNDEPSAADEDQLVEARGRRLLQLLKARHSDKSLRQLFTEQAADL